MLDKMHLQQQQQQKQQQLQLPPPSTTTTAFAKQIAHHTFNFKKIIQKLNTNFIFSNLKRFNPCMRPCLLSHRLKIPWQIN